MPNLGEFAFCVALCALPTVFCALIWRKSPLVRSLGRVLAVIGCVSVVGWALIAAETLWGSVPVSGFARLCAIAFGWVYVWIVGIPILLFSFLLRCCFDVGWWIRRKLTRRDLERGKSIWCVALLLAVSLIVYPYVLTVRPNEQWKDWGDRQYRLQRVDNIVHVEIREGNDVCNVDTRASTFHRYAVEVSSEDELLLKSSDIGNWLIGKHGGRWRVYVRENGELRCVNNEILKEGAGNK